MNSILSVYLVVLLVPLFVASWRVSIAGLSAQGLLMAWMVMSRRPVMSAALVISLVDLALVRGIFVPLAMHRVVRAQHRPTRNDMIPPNMLSWAVTVTLVMLSFRCASWLVAAPGAPHLHVAVAGTGVLLGMFVLAAQNGPFSQAVGALRLENAIALFELASPAHVPLGLQIGQVAVFGVTAFAYVVYVQQLYPMETIARTERPSL